MRFVTYVKRQDVYGPFELLYSLGSQVAVASSVYDFVANVVQTTGRSRVTGIGEHPENPRCLRISCMLLYFKVRCCRCLSYLLAKNRLRDASLREQFSEWPSQRIAFRRYREKDSSYDGRDAVRTSRVPARSFGRHSRLRVFLVRPVSDFDSIIHHSHCFKIGRVCYEAYQPRPRASLLSRGAEWLRFELRWRQLYRPCIGQGNAKT